MMKTVKVTFVNYTWDNYQGSSGKLFKHTELIPLSPETSIGRVRDLCFAIWHDDILIK